MLGAPRTPFVFIIIILNQPRLSSLLHCALLISKTLRSDSDGDYTCEQFRSLIVQAKSKGTVTKRRLTYFLLFLSCGSKFLFDYLLCQHRKILLAKMLIITSQIGNGIRINKGEMTVIMVVLMGSACIIKGRIQRNNTDPLGCAAALFWARWTFSSAAAIHFTFNASEIYVDRPACWHVGTFVLK